MGKGDDMYHNPGNIRCAPKGKYRIVGYDQYDFSDYFAGDYGTLNEALERAREKASKPNASPPSFSDKFYIFDDRGNCLKKITHTK